jgi:hypothetical protein
VWWSDEKNVDSVKSLPKEEKKGGGSRITGGGRTETLKFGKGEKKFTEKKKKSGFLPNK